LGRHKGRGSVEKEEDVRLDNQEVWMWTKFFLFPFPGGWKA
jgi:hypothetical protein